MQIYSEKNMCCGCTACYHICPVQAISMETDEEGFQYPVVDEEKCIHCNRCKTVCTFQSGYESNAKDQLCYGARLKDESILKMSSSGGMFFAFAKHVIERGGIVFGARYNENLEVEHAETESLQGLFGFMGSKYVQSRIDDVFKKIGEYLSAEREVLFSGTPCQNAGLVSYLNGKNISRENLWTIDIVCHGVNSPQILGDYVRMVEEATGKKIIKINMRDKSQGWNAKKASFWEENDAINDISDKYPYSRIYSSMLGVRESCFNCIFTNMNRVSDVTLADFWNIPSNSPMNDDRGVSSVILNTEKGKDWFEKIKSEIDYEEYTVQQIWQPHFEFSAAKPKGRARFWQEYQEKGSNYVIKKYAKGTFLSNIIRTFTPLLKKIGLYKSICKNI